MALWPADRVRPASVNYSGEQQRPHIRQRNSSSRCLDAVFKGHRGQSSDKRDRVEVPGQPGLELFLAAHGQRPTPAKRQYAHHRIFLRPPLRSDERRRDRLGIRQSVLRQASLWRPGGLREQPGVPGIPLQRRRDRPRSSKRLTAALRQGTPHLEPAGLSMSAPNYSLWQMVQYMAKLGAIGFGGPVALVGYMHRDLVEQRKWISETDYKEGLTLAQLMPGPLAAQLAIYLGYVHYRNLGATVVGVAFVLPSFLMVIALGAAYVAYGGLTWMQAVFYGVGASVIGIIAISAYKLTTKSIGKDKLLWAIYVCAAAVTVVTESEIVWLFLISGVWVWLVKAPPRNWFGGGASSLASAGVQLPAASAVALVIDWPQLLQIGLFFAAAGAFVFGSGLAIVPFLYGGVVNEYHWLNERQFIDAVAD